MSHNSAPPTMIEILVRFTYGGNDYDVVLTDKDFVGENFEAHKSLCNDASFHLGGCVSEWIKFTTTRMTFLDGNEVEHPIPWDKSALQVCVATTPIQPSDTYNYVRSFGVYFGQSYTEKVNHSQVEVTAYDYMYLINNFDVTDWYNNYAGTYPNGRAIDTFWSDFSGWLQQAVFAKYNYPTTPNMSYSPALMSVYAYKERLFWCPKPSINSGGSTVTIDLFSGVVTAGMIIKGLAAAFGTNAYLFYPDTVGSSVKGRLYFFEIGDYAQDSVSLVPTDYFAFEYSSFDTTPYTNIRMAVYEALWKANNNEDMTYGFANNWVFNSMSNIEIIDDPTIGDDPTPLQTVAQLLLARFNNVNNGIFRPMSVTTDKYFEIGQQIVVTDTDGNVYNSIIMQRDYTGIYGKSITYTCIGTEDYFKEGDIGGENAVSGSLSDLSGKVPIEGGTSSSVASWEIKPSGVDLKKSGNSVMKIDSSGLSIDAKSIKKNGTELATVATSGSYNDLSNKPTIPSSASDVGAMPISGGTFTGGVSWNNVSLPQFSGGNIPYFLGIEGFADGGQMKWLGKADVKTALGVPTNANYLERGAWWVSGSGQNIDSITSGIHFVYTDHGAPTTGTLIAFSGTDVGGYPSSSYCWQMILAYNTGTTLYVRNRNGDNGTWGAWRRIARADEIPTALSQLTNDITYINSRGYYVFDASTVPKDHPLGISTGFVNSGSGFGSYGSVLTVRNFSEGGGTLQIYAPYSPTYGGTRLKARFGNYDVGGGNTWTALKEIAWLEDVTNPTLLREVDTRNDNQTPAWYMSTYGKSSGEGALVSEFKYANKVGISSSASFGMMITAIPWLNNSGTRPVQFFISAVYGFFIRYATSDTAWGAWQDVMSGSWSGGQISNSGIAYANANNEIGWIAGFGSQGYLKLTGGKTSGKTGLLDVVADTWVLEGANNTSGYNKWIYHGKLGTNRFQCGTASVSSNGTISFSPAFAGVPVLTANVVSTGNRTLLISAVTASGFTYNVNGSCTIHWHAYYNA